MGKSVRSWLRRWCAQRSALLGVVAMLTWLGCHTPKYSIAPPPPPSRVDEVASFSPPQPERWVLANGVRVLFLRDEELPVVRGRLFIRGGSLWGPQSPVGAVSAMGDLMRQGGAGDLSADALDRELEKLAAGVGSSFGGEFGTVSFSCLAPDFQRVFKIFSDVTLRPRFEGERTSLWKGQVLEGIRRRKDDPQTVASLSFTKLMYGETLYGKIMEAADVAAIHRSLLVSLHQQFVRPDEAILVVTGRISREQVAQAVQDAFGSWSARGAVLPPAPPVPDTPHAGIYFIALPFTQASVQMGQLGVPRLTPDYPAIDLFNELFGSGGFGSRLMNRVRSELGLTYGVYGGISPGVVKGINYIFLQTKVESVVPAIEASLGVLRDVQQVAPQPGELAEKKKGIRNSFVFNFDSIDEVAVRTAKLELLSYPADYDQTYLAKIAAVEPADVMSVANQRWDASQFVVVVVGDESAYSTVEAATRNPQSPLYGRPLRRMGFESGPVVPTRN